MHSTCPQARPACSHCIVAFRPKKVRSRPRSGQTLAECRRLHTVTNKAMAVAADGNSEETVVSIPELRDLVVKAVQNCHFSYAEAQAITEVLLWAQVRGNSQGPIKIPAGAIHRPASAGRPQIDFSTSLSAHIDGKQEFGMLVLQEAAAAAIARAGEHGVGIVGASNLSSSTGALGYFAEQIAQQGFIAIIMSQSPEFVAPHGANEAVFGTNPIAVSIPQAAGPPLTIDVATSAVAWYDLVRHRAQGQAVAEDVGYDAQGQPSTDPDAILRGGALRVFDRSHKGSAFALMIELLGGAWAGGAVVDKLASKSWGQLVVAVQPGILGSAEAFKQRVSDLCQRVKSARRVPGVQEILLPGESSSRLAAQRLASGTTPISPQLLQQLQEAASGTATAAAPQQAARPSAEVPPAQGPVNGSIQHTAVVNTPGSTLSLATRLTHPRFASGDPYGAASPPLYQTATFRQLSAVECGPYDYTRTGNPTRTQLEDQMAEIEGADRAFAFASGMAALSAVLRLAKAGDHIVAGDDLYGGTSRLLERVAPGLGLEVTSVNTSSIEAVRSAIVPGRTRLVMLESPTNPRMQICDLQALCTLAREAGAVSVVDNSILAPVFQQPLALGADICMTSATKFIGGHADLTAGILSVQGAELVQQLAFTQNAEGTHLAPFECWLAMRGLQTMALRMERQAATAERLAAFLVQHPLVTKVNYPGLAGHPGHDINRRQATSGGSLLSFETGSIDASRTIVEETKLFKITVSFGSVSSLISLPCYMSHASIPAALRASRGLPDDLIRISVGIEDPKDLLADLAQAMLKAAEAAGRDLPADSRPLQHADHDFHWKKNELAATVA